MGMGQHLFSCAVADSIDHRYPSRPPQLGAILDGLHPLPGSAMGLLLRVKCGAHNIAVVMPALGCDERTRLLNKYNSATMAFSASVAELVQKAGTTLQGEYK